METVMVIASQQGNNTTPTFITQPSEVVRAVVGMETVLSYSISDDDVTTGLSIVPVTMLPSGVSLEQAVMSNDTG